MKINVEHVDQMTALDWLTANTHNRPLRKDVVRRLVEDMKNDRWMDNGETIKFSHDGVLLDGQHRLMAIVEADVNIPLIVVRDLDESAQATIDIGAVRTTGNILALNGIPNGPSVASLAKILVRYQNDPKTVWSSSSDPTKVEVVEFSIANAERLVWACNIAVSARNAMGAHRVGYGALAYLVSENSRHAKKWEGWHEGILTGANLQKGDPRLSFRNYHGRRMRVSGAWESQAQVAIAIKAWNSYVTNKEAQILRFSQSELPMPKVR